jgi:parallel beta-helix repeat protein
LWLGYSFNSLVKGNEIIGNQYAGIAIDRGYSNQIAENEIVSNPTGIELWEGTGISPYQNQNSGDYFIHNNLIEGNTTAISLKETEHSVIRENEFRHNRNGIFIYGDAENDSLTDNVFSHTAFYHIENNSPEDIHAIDNNFEVNDEAMIECNIFDKADNQAFGEVIWQPYVPGPEPLFQDEVPEDMAEPDAVWYAYPEACWGYGLSQGTTVEWDYQEKVLGSASVHVSTGNGWDLGVMYRPAGGEYSSWSLLEEDTLTFYLKSANSSPYGFQFCSVILGNDCGGYYKYTASAGSILNPTIGHWKERRVPLAGSSPWTRTAYGNISFEEISYVEIHADTWDHGFDLWIDAVTFNGSFVFTAITPLAEKEPVHFLQISPNPASNVTSLCFNLPGDSWIALELLDINGRHKGNVFTGMAGKGRHCMDVDVSPLPDGLYLCRMISAYGMETKKLMINR